ncbi:hypothetical protein N865_13405 [Intrasporangium oryzae NRRL B-24470]|uniref:Chromosome partitioning protein n=1 Tax=Intrasporangium oryzae NRRL B-24470 TaxID=1386089 RepID=W9G3V5_9MICO|nr:P-loop NTPase [Intrasporangium oryzae]EWT00826.1 hypothetical protein N865_13405 [Intrasporangium oryzae NRRL B-24470]
MTEVVTGLSPQWESLVATALERVRGVTIARRCADVAELVSVAEAGIGQVAVVSHDLRGLDLSVVRRVREQGLRVVGLVPPDDEAAERRLRQLAVALVLPMDADPDRIGAALDDESTGGWPDGLDEATTALPGSVADPGSSVGPRSPDEPGWLPAGADRAPVHGDDAPRSRVVAVWGPTGAPGRTTVATNLAVEVASRGTEVVLVDADTYGGSVAQVLGLLDEAPGIAAACRAADHGGLDLPSLSRIAPYAASHLRVVTGLPRADRWPEVRGAALERVIELARVLAPVVVVDCGFCLEDDEELSYDTAAPRRNEATLTALATADVVVAVGGADPVALQRFVRGLQELGTVPSPEPVVVVNRVRSAAVGSRPEERIADSLLRFAGLEAVRFLPDDPSTTDAALLAGRSVVEQAPDSALRRAVTDLADAVVPWTRSRAGVRRRRWRRTAGVPAAG